jgi:hypothetical protein
MDTYEIQIGIQNKFRDQQTKFTYYLIAIAVAAIAFSINIAISLKLNYYQLPLGLAVISWAISIIYGFSHISMDLSVLWTNNALLDVMMGNHGYTGTDINRIKEGREILIEILNKKSDKTSHFGMWHNRWLYIGMAFFIVWTVLKMYSNNSMPAPTTHILSIICNFL